MERSEPGEETWEEVGSPGVEPRQRAWLRGLRAEQGAHPGASGLGWTSGARVAHAGCSPAPWGLFGDTVGANPSGAELSEAERLAGLLARLALPEVVAVLMLQPCLGRPVACPSHWTGPDGAAGPHAPPHLLPTERTRTVLQDLTPALATEPARTVLQDFTPAPATGPAPDGAAGPHARPGRCWPRRRCAGPHAVPVHCVGPIGPGDLVSAPHSALGAPVGRAGKAVPAHSPPLGCCRPVPSVHTPGPCAREGPGALDQMTTRAGFRFTLVMVPEARTLTWVSLGRSEALGAPGSSW